jgi:cytidylate kinase
MNAPDVVPDTRIEREVDRLLSLLESAHARQVIVDRYLAGWLAADHALETLILLNLIEFDERLLAERDAA